MSLNKNLHIIAGTLGRELEVRFSSAGNPVCTVNIAISRWDSQVKEEVTDWIRAVIFGKQAAYIGDSGKKGSEILLTGYVRTREYDDKDGIKRRVQETVSFDAQLPRLQRSESQSPHPAQSGSAWEAGTQDPDLDDVPF